MSCGADVAPLQYGGYRNHCPFCLCSLHVDVAPGDRGSACHGLMRPVGLDYRAGKGHMLVLRCSRCGLERPNRVAPDDTDALVSWMRARADG